MSVLALAVDGGGVTALAVGADGRVRARGHCEVPRHASPPDRVELVPEELWRATLGAAGEVVEQVAAADLGALGITCRADTVVLWDRETLGSPRRAAVAPDRRTVGDLLADLAEAEPHTWALVVAGRYAVGTVGSYLLARMTRGTWHVTDPSTAARTRLLDLRTGDWSVERCAEAGVPRDALPELVPTWGRLAATDPRSFLGLDLPVAALAAERSAALVTHGCLAPGDVALGPGSSLLALTGGLLPAPADGLLPTLAWHSPTDGPAYALEGRLGNSPDAGARAVGDLLRALPSGVAAPLHVDGDAADAPCQALADATGVAVERSPVTDTPALGAALLAGLGTGLWTSLEELRAVRPRGRVFEPRDPTSG